ncbi:response regulator [Paenibacillus macerans]|uniref:response regulator n=1 Tax=Paenibacillus macerans TaxID=44252 RepID=UPI003D3126BC
MKIRVLLADDEPVILRGLKKLIAWEELGFSIIGEANDGNELKQLMQECRPDLIISDISMPGCSGIDIIREIHEASLPMKVIFISAYQEFAYARQAIQYGAVDYLVKPVNQTHLESVVGKAAALIREENEGERAKEMLTHYERKQRTVTIEELLDGLMDGDKRAAAELTRMGAVALSRHTSVCMLETDETMGSASRWEERERKLVQFALYNIIKETVDPGGNCLMFQKDGRFGILIQHESADEPRKLANDLHGKINVFLKLPVSIGIGRPVSGIEAASASYRAALEALIAKYFTGLNRVLEADETAADRSEEPCGLAELEEKMIKALMSQNREELHASMNRLLRAIEQQAEGSKQLAVMSAYNTILLLDQSMAKIGIQLSTAIQEPNALLARLSGYATFEGVKKEFASVVEHACEQISHKLANKEVTELQRIKTYMEEHYAENITLESMAALIYMNPYYFSSFFKKHTGKNFKQYLTEERMKQALRLLLETDLMIYEIAERVGYNNARHFSDMFKKMYGKLPQEYRQSAGAE